MALRKNLAWTLALVLLLTAVPAALAAPAAPVETVALPITVDYPLLRALLARQSFDGPGESALVLDEFQGCTFIELSQPQVGPEGEYLRLRCAIKVRVGVPLGSKCLKPVEWQGFIELVQEPRLMRGSWDLRFTTLESRLFNKDGQPAKLAQTMWDLVKGHVHAYLDRQAISLAPPMQELQSFLPLLLDQRSQARAQAWLKSLRPGPIRVTPLAVRADILMDAVPSPPAEAEERLDISDQELKRFIESWQAWDAFLVYEINFLARQPLTPQEQRLLLDTLLETRYRFVAELNQESPGRRDVVREQFVLAWKRLAPILRRHLEAEGQGPRLSYLGFFTAADALAALDKLGPTLGVEISRNGLIRLARLLEGEGGASPILEYGQGVDPALRRALGLGPAPDDSGPAFSEESLPWEPPAPQPPEGGIAPDPDGLTPVPSEPGQTAPPAAPTTTTPTAPPAWREVPLPTAPPSTSRFLRWLLGTAWAAPAQGEGPLDLQEIRPWVLGGNNRDFYLERLKEAIRVGARRTLEKKRLEPRHQEMFVSLALATAWQESCWRQFLANGGKITYLRSYNNSSVGVMQINERVWRGIYNLPSLRWNVLYNIRAGCEILNLYLRDYALPALDDRRPLDGDTLAKAVYAMYNGGPAQFERFLKRQSKKSYLISDKLFSEKYGWVKAGQWERLENCWGQ